MTITYSPALQETIDRLEREYANALDTIMHQNSELARLRRVEAILAEAYELIEQGKG